MQPETSINEGGGGGSRAAKKRAKKRNKGGPSEPEMMIPPANGTFEQEPAKKQKRVVASGSTRRDDNGVKKARKEKQKQIVRDTKDDDEDVEDEDSADDSDVEMKAPAAASVDKSAPVPECSSLRQIVQPDKNSTETTDQSLMAMPSKERATAALGYLLAPSGMSVGEFYDKYWEKQPLCVKAVKDNAPQHRRRFDGFLSLASIRRMLDTKAMYYGRDLNVTRYEKSHKDGVKRRVTLDLLNVKGSGGGTSDDLDDNFVRTDPEVVWGHYEQGCTIRLLCPHQHADSVHSLLSLFELEFGCMVGANAYLTPPGQSQGFAPHYDDIEAFCLQLEGRKRWKVYAPLNKAERLPRTSSSDYTDDDLKDVEPVLDVILEPGDVLYMPRGWIHQAITLPGGEKDKGHSLHLTVSAMQQWAWSDLMEMLLPEALHAATASESILLRSGLPRGFLDYTGAMYDNREENVPEILKRQNLDDEDDPDKIKAATIRRLQDEFRTEAKKRIMKVAKEAMDIIDATCDQMGKRFMVDRLPPAWTALEKSQTSEGRSEGVQLLPNTLCRLVRPGIARLVLEDEKAVLYHCVDNSRVHHEHPMSPMEFEMDDAPALEQLLTTTEPHWVLVQDLIHDTIEDKVAVAQALFDEGILAIRSADDEEEDE
jgi:lysine-specific demethylase/histidyl-hydroxylase NO66